MPTAREIAENTLAFVRRRKEAYMGAFRSNRPVRTIEKAYERVFLGQAGQLVLQDLAEFCRANSTVFDPNQRVTDVLIGRNEVWLRIQNQLNLNPDELYRLHGGLDIRLVTQEEEE